MLLARINKNFFHSEMMDTISDLINKSEHDIHISFLNNKFTSDYYKPQKFSFYIQPLIQFVYYYGETSGFFDKKLTFDFTIANLPENRGKRYNAGKFIFNFNGKEMICGIKEFVNAIIPILLKAKEDCIKKEKPKFVKHLKETFDAYLLSHIFSCEDYEVIADPENKGYKIIKHYNQNAGWVSVKTQYDESFGDKEFVIKNLEVNFITRTKDGKVVNVFRQSYPSSEELHEIAFKLNTIASFIYTGQFVDTEACCNGNLL